MTSTVASAGRAPAMGTAKLAAAGVVLAAVVIFAGNYHVAKGENGGTKEGLSTAVICALVAAVLFGLVPRLRHRASATLVLGVLTFLSLAVFWSGVTPILAAATLAVSDGQERVTRRTTVVRGVAIVAAALTVVVTLAQSHLF